MSIYETASARKKRLRQERQEADAKAYDLEQTRLEAMTLGERLAEVQSLDELKECIIEELKKLQIEEKGYEWLCHWVPKGFKEKVKEFAKNLRKDG